MYDTSSVNTPHGRVGNGPGDLYIWVTQTSSSSFWLIALKSSLINFDCRTNTSSFSVSCKNSNLYRWSTGELQVIHDKVSTTSYRTEELQVHAYLNIENIRPNVSTETLTSGWNLRYARLSCLLLNERVIRNSMPNSDSFALTNLYCREILLCHDPCSSCLFPPSHWFDCGLTGVCGDCAGSLVVFWSSA